MHNKATLMLGEKVDIVINYKTYRQKTYFSMIQDIYDDAIVINLPMLKGEVAFLYMGQELAINYFRECGQYQFIATVIARHEKEGSYFFTIKRTSDISRLQRRDFYRLPKVIPVKIDIPLGEDAVKSIDGNTFDICGGGLGVAIEQYISPDTNIICSFELETDNSIDKFQLAGRVVRCNPSADKDHNFEIGISFIDIPEGQRDIIIKFIFDEQRLLRKRDLL